MFKSTFRNVLAALFHKNVKNNQILVVKPDGKLIRKLSIKGLEIRFYGSGNLIKIYEPYSFGNSKIEMTNNMKIEIGPACRIRNFMVSNTWNNSDSVLDIGKSFNCNGANINPTKNGSVKIGDNCLFSWDINIKTSNDHLVYNKGDLPPVREHQNKPVSIGNHVWIGMGAIVLKGVNIPSESIVGAAAVVSKPFDQEHIALAGNPAKIVKQEVCWDN